MVLGTPERPEDTKFWEHGEEVVFDDDVDLAFVLFESATAKVIGVFDEREDAKDAAQNCGVRDWQIEAAPANFSMTEDVEYPNLP